MSRCAIVFKLLKQENDFSKENIEIKIAILNDFKAQSEDEVEHNLIDKFVKCLKYFLGDKKAILSVQAEIRNWFCSEFNLSLN